MLQTSSAVGVARHALVRRFASASGALALALCLLLPPATVLAAAGGDCAATQRAADTANPAAGAIGGSAEQDNARMLAAARLIIPVAGVTRASLRDSFDECRGTRRHEAIDIAAPLHTPVIAAGAGRVAKLFNSVPGGLTVYQFDAEEQFAYYYAHLYAYAPGLHEGMQLQRGDLLGYVGVSGNAPPAAPHLHFAIFRLGPEKKWWQGEAVNPYPLLDDAQR